MNLSALTSLQRVNFSTCAISTLTITNLQPIVECTGISNTLTSPEVDGILVALDGNGLNGGTVDLSGQTPSAPPTGTGRIAAASLIVKGWTVTLDEIAWAPATETVTWIDTNGTFTNNLAAFLASADFDTVSSMVFGATGLLTSLTGLQALTALATLDCNTNALTSLDLSNCSALTTLNCYSNASLTTLTLTGCTALVTLDCSNCSLTSLDVHDSTLIDKIDCYTNQINSLNVTGCSIATHIDASQNLLVNPDVTTCVSLTYLSLGGNSTLTTLDAHLNTSLQTLDCGSPTSLTSVNVTGCVLLENFYIDGTNIVTLDVSTCSSLLFLDCSGSTLLTALDVSASTGLTDLIANGCSLASINITGCTAIKLIICHSNQITNVLPTYYINNMLVALASSGVVGGSVECNNQTPPAPPNVGPPDGIAAVATLTGYGLPWSVITD